MPGQQIAEFPLGGAAAPLHERAKLNCSCWRRTTSSFFPRGAAAPLGRLAPAGGPRGGGGPPSERIADVFETKNCTALAITTSGTLMRFSLIPFSILDV